MSEKFDVMVNADWVNEQLKLNNTNFVLLDVPYGKNEYIKENDPDKRVFEDKHLPGAVVIHKEDFENKENDLNILPAVDIEDKFLSLGIDKDTTLVVYSDGINGASRVAFIAYWLGVDQVKIMNGGLEAWGAAGYAFESGKMNPKAKTSFGLNVPKRPEILIQTPEEVIKAQENNKKFRLASVRSWEEFVGETSGYPWIDTAGEPLGAVYAKASQKRTDVKSLLKDNGEWGDTSDILKNWEEWGITSETETAFYCGSGWRATIPFFFAKSLGWENVKLYDGGWYQWLKYHRENPEKYKIQVGNPKEKVEIF